MIVLNLSCENTHLFEGWFASTDAFEEQLRCSLVACPICGSTSIERRPNAPYVNTHTAGGEQGKPVSPSADKSGHMPMSPETVAKLVSTLRILGRESEDVGAEFADEARRIHHGESEARNIKGKASGEDVSELLDEGILILPLPPDEGDLH